MNLLIRVFYLLQKFSERIALFFILKFKGVCYNNLSTFRGIPFILNNGKIIIEDNVIINSKYRNNPIGGNSNSSFWTKKGGKIIISKGVRISNSAFVSEKGIFIGKNTFIGGDCKIYDTDFHSLLFEERIQRPDINVKSAKVHIGEEVFIGTGAIIMKGVNIGEKSIIGAGSVVTKNIPAGEIWGGNPARFIRKLYKI
ncbi:MAG: acyltransferase [Bacteroidetes bacterium]|nr:acyltransferase [Bacteroidota bacterium]